MIVYLFLTVDGLVVGRSDVSLLGFILIGLRRGSRRLSLFWESSRLAESANTFATCDLVFLPPLGGRTNHPLIPEVLAHRFSPALKNRVGSSTDKDGWPLASLIC